ncbi:glycoside hydrolase family 5 protein [Hyalangium versicolor]|uniref:glycoside hydrolase family 5 protein n=1 Tax=Hyalangium versicolor TaxID=2861190 RepID=UPI001CCC9688|nr:cellulase family glycosylhydrolase [Hyalangium versicolor]
MPVPVGSSKRRGACSLLLLWMGVIAGCGSEEMREPGVVATTGVESPLLSGSFRVMGNRIVDANGAVQVFRGVARPSLEWSCNGDGNPGASGLGIQPGEFDVIRSWGANIVRLSVNWRFASDSSCGLERYLENVHRVIAWIQARNMDVLLDLHTDDWSYNPLPPQEAATFWAELARRFGDQSTRYPDINGGRILFQLYNEPTTPWDPNNTQDSTWAIWRDGGLTTRPDNRGTYISVGMQALYNAVRQQGARNVVVVNGLHWGYDLSRATEFRLRAHDGSGGAPFNLAYGTMPYKQAPIRDPSQWDQHFGNLAATDPVVITEFGQYDCKTDYVDQLIHYSRYKGLSWVGWAWWVEANKECSFPNLITDWSGTPTAMGASLRRALQGLKPLVEVGAGIFRPGRTWALDQNRNGFDGGDVLLDMAVGGDVPVVGDWLGTGRDKPGLYRASDGMWFLDLDNDGWEPGVDRQLQFGGFSGDVPVVGDWTGLGRTHVGVFRGGTWALDLEGDGWNGTARFISLGQADDTPVVGSWDGSGQTRVGVVRVAADGLMYWLLDMNGNGWDGADRQLQFGLRGDVPVVGDWTGTGQTRVGVFRNGMWFLDLNGNGYDGETGVPFGKAGDVPVVGDWSSQGRGLLGVVRRMPNGLPDWILDVNANGEDTGDRRIQFGFNADRFLPGHW